MCTFVYLLDIKPVGSERNCLVRMAWNERNESEWQIFTIDLDRGSDPRKPLNGQRLRFRILAMRILRYA